MDHAVWREILELMPNDKLCILTNKCGLKVAGFRKITSENMNVCKSRLIMESLKPKNIIKIIDFFDKLYKKNEDRKAVQYREMNLDELIEATNSGSPAYEILASLYSGKEQSLFDLANSFENYMQNESSSKDESVEKNEKIEVYADDQLSLLRDIVNDLEKKVNKSESKNEELFSIINKLKEEYQNDKNEWDKEKRKLLQKEKDLQEQIVEIQQNNENLITENQKLTKELANKTSEIAELNSQFTEVQNLIKDNQTTAAMENSRKVALIGNPKNQAITKNNKIDFSIFETSQLEEALEEKVLDHFEEIWMLTYKIPSTKQKLIYSHIHQPILEINTFQDLKTLVEKG